MKESARMSEKKTTYLEQQIDAEIIKEKGTYTFTFQREKIRLDQAIEVELLKEMDPLFKREIVTNENELRVIVHTQEQDKPFQALKGRLDLQRWMFGHQLVEKVRDHAYTRLHLVVCPENIVFNKGMEPFFLHYGVKESLPPYEKNEERLFNELKATVAAAVDTKYSFFQYLTQHKTLQLSEDTKRIIECDTTTSLLHVLEERIDQIDHHERSLVRMPKKKWNWLRYSTIGLSVLLVPAIAYIVYALFFQQPKQEAFMDANKAFIQENYSAVADDLEAYDVDEMPMLIKYELSRSYVMNKNLPQEATANILNAITLQSDEDYLNYWIYIGRGEGKAALDIARTIDERDLIIMALNTYTSELKSDNDLAVDERQQKLDEVKQELTEFKDEIKKEEEEAAKQAEEENESSSPSTPAQTAPAKPSTTQPSKPAQNQPAGQKPATEKPATGANNPS